MRDEKKLPSCIDRVPTLLGCVAASWTAQKIDDISLQLAERNYSALVGAGCRFVLLGKPTRRCQVSQHLGLQVPCCSGLAA